MTRSMRLLACTGALAMALISLAPAASADVQTTGTFVGQRVAWSQVRSNYPTTAFWNSADEARVGYLNDGVTIGVNRAIFRMDVNGLQGKQIISARFVTFETWAWGCTPKPVQVWQTTAISASTTWVNQPTWQFVADQVSVAKGNTLVGCSPPGFVEFNVTAAVQAAANAGQPVINLGLRAGSETDPGGWKRFRNNPYLDVLFQDA
jgi:hypothetical protein